MPKTETKKKYYNVFSLHTKGSGVMEKDIVLEHITMDFNTTPDSMDTLTYMVVPIMMTEEEFAKVDENAC